MNNRKRWTATVLCALSIFTPPSLVLAQAGSAQTEAQKTKKTGADPTQDLTAQLAHLQEQVSQLQNQLQQQGVSTPALLRTGAQNRQTQMTGMQKDTGVQQGMPMSGGGMGMMDNNMMAMMGQMMGGMGMGKPMMDDKMGMGAMGQMSGGVLSALPGYPGASHLYHIGATNFFLDHPQHIALSLEQQKKLSAIRDQALAEQAQADRKIAERETELWQFTSADQPPLTKIESTIKEIEELHSAQRLAWIKSVGEATKVLAPEQRQALLGQAPPMGMQGSQGMTSGGAMQQNMQGGAMMMDDSMEMPPMGGPPPSGNMPSGGAMGDM